MAVYNVKFFLIFGFIVNCGNILGVFVEQILAFAAKIVIGSGSLIGRLLPLNSVSQNGLGRKLLSYSLSPQQVSSEQIYRLIL